MYVCIQTYIHAYIFTSRPHAYIPTKTRNRRVCTPASPGSGCSKASARSSETKAPNEAVRSLIRFQEGVPALSEKGEVLPRAGGDLAQPRTMGDVVLCYGGQGCHGYAERERDACFRQLSSTSDTNHCYFKVSCHGYFRRFVSYKARPLMLFFIAYMNV